MVRAGTASEYYIDIRCPHRELKEAGACPRHADTNGNVLFALAPSSSRPQGLGCGCSRPWGPQGGVATCPHPAGTGAMASAVSLSGGAQKDAAEPCAVPTSCIRTTQYLTRSYEAQDSVQKGLPQQHVHRPVCGENQSLPGTLGSGRGRPRGTRSWGSARWCRAQAGVVGAARRWKRWVCHTSATSSPQKAFTAACLLRMLQKLSLAQSDLYEE